MNPREIARAEYLAQEFSRIAVRVDAGASVVRELRALARRRSRHLPHGRLSEGAIRNLFYLWRREPSPRTLLRRYQGAKRTVPAALLLEFLNRMSQGEVVSAHAAFNSLRSDWRRGMALPGLGAWREFAGARRCTPPPFPFGRSTFYEHLAPGSGRRFQKLAAAALRGQRDVRRFEAYLETRRAAFASETRHDGLALPRSRTA